STNVRRSYARFGSSRKPRNPTGKAKRYECFLAMFQRVRRMQRGERPMKLCKILGVATILVSILASAPNVARAVSPSTTDFKRVGSGELYSQKFASTSGRECSSILSFSSCNVQQAPSYKFVGVWGEFGKRKPPSEPTPQDEQSNRLWS